MNKKVISINKEMLGSSIQEIFEYYLDSDLDSGSSYEEYEKAVSLFFITKDLEFEKQFLNDYKSKKNLLNTSDSGVYFSSKQGKLYEALLNEVAEGFSNFCLVVNNVISGVPKSTKK